MRRAFCCLALAALLTGACERKAPGPDECIAFAVLAAGGNQRVLQRPELRERIDDLTRRCLTTPYDRRLLQCVAETGRVRACTADFERRRGP